MRGGWVLDKLPEKIGSEPPRGGSELRDSQSKALNSGFRKSNICPLGGQRRSLSVTILSIFAREVQMLGSLSKIAGKSAISIASALLFSTAPAIADVNLGFEAGNTTGWTAGGSGPYGATDTYGPYVPVEGAYFAFVQAADQDVYTTLSQDFVLSAGEKLTGSVGFKAFDSFVSGAGLNDSGYLSINGTELFQKDVATVGDFGSTGWQTFSFTAPIDGTYTLQIGVANHGDNQASSGIVLDNVAVQANLPPPPPPSVPEPSGWSLMLLGIGGIGAVLRQHARRPSPKPEPA